METSSNILRPALALLVVALAPWVCTKAGAQANTGGATPTIRHIDDYYRLTPDLQAQPNKIDLDLTVHVYDQDWNNLWGEADGNPVFLRLTQTPLPLRSGQHVRIQGQYSTNGLVPDAGGITVLPPVKTAGPIEVGEKLLDWGNLNGRLCSFEGFVDQQYEQDSRHHAIIAVINGWKVIVWVLHEPGELVPSYEGYIIRITGVYSRTADTLNRLNQLEVWVPYSSMITRLDHVSQSSWFNKPVTAIDSFPEAPPNQRVRIAGKVLSQATGRTVTVRDESGQAVVETAQTEVLNPGDSVEAVGIPIADGVLFRLKEALFRKQIDTRNASPGTQPGILPRLRIAEQIRELSLEEATRHYPVRLRAAVTWAHPDADFFFVQDSSGGVRVEASAGDRESLKLGYRAEVFGETAAGAAAPLIKASLVQMHSPIGLPNSKALTLEQAITGIGEGELVEMTGFLRSISRDGRWLRLELTTSSGAFSALLPSTESAGGLVNSVVRIKGVCTSTVNDRGHITGVEVWLRSLADVSVVMAMPSDPFSLPRQTISRLGKFVSRSAANEWVCTRGVVTLFEPGRHLVVQDGSDSLHVLSRSMLPVSVGDEIDVVGLPGREENHYMLREAVYRRTGFRGDIRPVELYPPLSTVDELGWCLVRLDGELLDFSARSRSVNLILRSGTSIFECELGSRSENAADMDAWKPGSLLRVTGVYAVRHNEYFQPQDFHLLLRSGGDVSVIQPAAWWTIQRAVTMVIALVLVLLLGIFWNVLLRRKVKQQTSTIRTQMEKESVLLAELERSSRLESLGVLAGGIAHDFNNLLTVITGNIGLARMDEKVEAAAGSLLEEALKGAHRARSLTQQLLTFARGGSPLRRAQPIGPIIQDTCAQTVGQARIHCSIILAPDLWPAIIDKDQISQVVHAIVLNSVQAMPGGGRINVDACNMETTSAQMPTLPEGRYVKITFGDTGPGIPPDHLGKVFDPYFTTKGANRGLGLATVRSIIRKHDGYVEVLSPPERGAIVTLWLPAAAASAEAQMPAPAAKLSKKPLTGVHILFMDDEEPIQRMAASLFKRIGCAYCLAGSGEKALEAFIKAREAGSSFDLVITDLSVPNGMGGKELVQELLKIDPEARVVVSSGYSSDPVLAHFRDHGFVAMVPKPYQVEDLERTIRVALSSPKARITSQAEFS